MLNRSTIHLAVVALLTLLFAGCAVAPKTENLSVGATSMHSRTDGSAIGEADDLQSNPSDSPGFTPWGADDGD
jgi:hypothetical protein